MTGPIRVNIGRITVLRFNHIRTFRIYFVATECSKWNIIQAFNLCDQL